jgi:hypothetical protein
MSGKGAESSDRPLTGKTNEKVDTAKEVALANSSITSREVANTLRISSEVSNKISTCFGLPPNLCLKIAHCALPVPEFLTQSTTVVPRPPSSPDAAQ